MDQCALRRRRPRKKPKTVLSKLMPTLKFFGNCQQLACDQLMLMLVPLLTFVKDSRRVLKRCSKPDRLEFQRSVLATAVGFFIMGSLGFIIKLLHIPIANILMG